MENSPNSSIDSNQLTRSLSFKLNTPLNSLRRAKSHFSLKWKSQKLITPSPSCDSLSTSTSQDQDIRLKPSYSHVSIQKSIVSCDSFEKIQLIGRGDVGKVYLVRDKRNSQYYAMKCLSKEEMIRRNKIKRVLAEQEILVFLSCIHG